MTVYTIKLKTMYASKLIRRSLMVISGLSMILLSSLQPLLGVGCAALGLGYVSFIAVRSTISNAELGAKPNYAAGIVLGFETFIFGGLGVLLGGYVLHLFAGTPW